MVNYLDINAYITQTNLLSIEANKKHRHLENRLCGFENIEVMAILSLSLINAAVLDKLDVKFDAKCCRCRYHGVQTV